MEGFPLRILHTVRQYYPAVGGLESYVKSMVEHQKLQGAECTVLTLDKVFHGKTGKLPVYEVVDGTPVHRVPFIGKRRFFLPLVPPSFFGRFDLIHVHNTDVFFDYIAAIATLTKKPAFATTHGGFFHTQDYAAIKKLYFRLITRNTGKRYRALFAISQNDYNIFKGINENLILKPNAITPLGDFLTDGKDFLYLGRLARHKQVDALIKTFAILKHKHELAGNLHIIGPEWDAKIKDLTLLAKRLGVSEKVIFHGFISPEEMQKILQGCGTFLSASSFEGFGMSMLEAMSLGLIPFVQPNESFRELVAASGVGACVDFTSPEEAAAEISGRLSHIGRHDRQKAQEFALLFSWQKLAEETLQTYRELC